MAAQDLTKLKLRVLEGSAKFFYHRYCNAEARLNAEMIAALTGLRVGTKLADRARKDRDEAYELLLDYLQEITRRVRLSDGLLPDQDDDLNVGEYFKERRRRLDAAAEKATI